MIGQSQKDREVTSKAFIRLAAIVIGLLLIPFFATLLSDEVNWSVSDFILMGVLALVVGTIFIMSSRRFVKPWQRLIIALSCVALLLYVWAELAVGIFTNLGS